MNKNVYIYYANRLYFKGAWGELSRQEYLDIPEGSYIFHPYKKRWSLKGESVFLEEDHIPPETRAAHLIESM